MLITDSVKFKTGHAGLFTTDKEWIHPVICEKTYEIIYVTEGVVHLFEGEKKHTLKEGSALFTAEVKKAPAAPHFTGFIFI